MFVLLGKTALPLSRKPCPSGLVHLTEADSVLQCCDQDQFQRYKKWGPPPVWRIVGLPTNLAYRRLPVAQQ